MGGLVLDIYVEFIIRVIIRFFKARGSKSWPIVTAKVTGTNLRRGGVGCAVADLTYRYRLDGEPYNGSDANPFILDNSAKDYLERYPRGAELLIRVKAGKPEFSVVRQDDLYRHAHGYQLASK